MGGVRESEGIYCGRRVLDETAPMDVHYCSGRSDLRLGLRNRPVALWHMVVWARGLGGWKGNCRQASQTLL